MNKSSIEQFLFGRYGAALDWFPHTRTAVREALTTTATAYNAGLQHAAKICADTEVLQDMCLGARRATVQACEKRILACIEPAATQVGSCPDKAELKHEGSAPAPAAGHDSRVTLPPDPDWSSWRKVETYARAVKLAAIDLQAEVERLKAEVDTLNQAGAAMLMYAGELKLRAEAKPTITEAQIVDICGTSRYAAACCREVLWLAGAEVK